MEIKTDTRKEASEQDMDCIEEIIRRLSMHGLVDENCVRVILNDYNISQKCTEVIPANEDRTQKAIRMCEEMHGSENWELDTILQESKNCYLYEKMGYRQTGKTKVINERLTLTFYEKKEADIT